MSGEVRRYDCTSGGAQHCYGCYTMTEASEGDYVAWDDYADLLARYEAVVGSRETGPNVIPECLSHPDAPHGYDRTSSHSLGRYVCDCEGWTPDEDDRAMQDNGDKS